jgi:hypothetical protein
MDFEYVILGFLLLMLGVITCIVLWLYLRNENEGFYDTISSLSTTLPNTQQSATAQNSVRYTPLSSTSDTATLSTTLPKAPTNTVSSTAQNRAQTDAITPTNQLEDALSTTLPSSSLTSGTQVNTASQVTQSKLSASTPSSLSTTLPPGAINIAPTGTLSPGATNIAQTGTLPPGATNIAQTGIFPPGASNIAPTGILPPGATNIAQTGTSPPGATNIAPTGTLPPGATNFTQTGTLPPGATNFTQTGATGAGSSAQTTGMMTSSPTNFAQNLLSSNASSNNGPSLSITATIPQTSNTSSAAYIQKAASCLDQNRLLTNAMESDTKKIGFNYIAPHDEETQNILTNYLQTVFEDIQALGCFAIKQMLDPLRPTLADILKNVKCSDLRAELKRNVFDTIVLPNGSPVAKDALVTHITNLLFAIISCNNDTQFADATKTIDSLNKVIAAICFMV